MLKQPDPGRCDAISVTVAHDQFKELGVPAVHRFGHHGAVLYDVKHRFFADQIDGPL